METEWPGHVLYLMHVVYIIPFSFSFMESKKMDEKREVSEASSWFGAGWIRKNWTSMQVKVSLHHGENSLLLQKRRAQSRGLDCRGGYQTYPVCADSWGKWMEVSS